MLVVKIKTDLLKKFCQNPQMLMKEDRPCILILKLNYKEKTYIFAVPIRSNIPAAPQK